MTYKEYNEKRAGLFKLRDSWNITTLELRIRLKKLDEEYAGDDETPHTGMTFLEYKDKEADIINAHANGSITRDVMYKLLEDNRKAYNEWQEYRKYGKYRLHPSTVKEQLDRMEEAQKRMRERRDEIANHWAKAYTEDGKIKVKKGLTGLPLVDMTVLEARLLAAQILSLTNPKIKRS